MQSSPTWTRGKDGRPRVMVLAASDRENVRAWIGRLRPIIARHADIVETDLQIGTAPTDIEADFAIVLGGDGTILRSARYLRNHPIPVLCVNLGRLGFLAALPPEALEETLPQVCGGQCRVVDHLMLECSILRDGETVATRVGLNEVAVLGGPPFSMLNVELYVDADLATTYSCDGLIISTPVGSTAHNLSAGGPILRQTLAAFVISPISPHTLTVRPVVDSADRVFEMVVPKPNEGTAVVVDGHMLDRVLPADRIRVQRASATFRRIEVHQQSYYRTLRDKLGWGGNLHAR